MSSNPKNSDNKTPDRAVPLFSFNRGGTYGGFSFFVMETSFLLFAAALQLIAGTFLKSKSAVFSLVTAFSMPLALAITLLVNKKLFGLTAAESLSVKKFKPAFSVFAVVLAVSMMFGLGFINYVFVDFLKSFGINAGGIEVEINGFLQYAIFVFSLCVFPAIAEELFFRGVLICGLKNAGTIAVCFVSALFFAFYHCSLAQFFYQFIFGFFLALITVKSKSVFPAVIAHFINNFSVLTLEYTGWHVDFFNAYYIIAGLAALTAWSVSFYFYTAKLKKESGEEKSEKVKGEIVAAILPFGILAILLCAIVIAGNVL